MSLIYQLQTHEMTPKSLQFWRKLFKMVDM